VLLRRFFVETASAELALGELALVCCLQDLALLPGRLVIVVSCLLETGPQLKRLGLPLWNLLLGLALLDLAVDRLSFLDQLLLLVRHDALVLRVEGLSLLLEDLPADVLVLGDTVRVELPPAALTALH
jgi:hypothetical protein